MPDPIEVRDTAGRRWVTMRAQHGRLLIQRRSGAKRRTGTCAVRVLSADLAEIVSRGVGRETVEVYDGGRERSDRAPPAGEVVGQIAGPDVARLLALADEMLREGEAV